VPIPDSVARLTALQKLVRVVCSNYPMQPVSSGSPSSELGTGLLVGRDPKLQSDAVAARHCLLHEHACCMLDR